ncbi:MAG: hypothetical protein ACREFE_03845 [Limisphaerales bacterium]
MKLFFPRGGLFLILAILFARAFPSKAAVWQWSVSVDSITMPHSQAHPRAFLWIPPDCKRVRAVVLGQYNMLEDPILQDREFRKTLAQLGIAEILIAPTFDTWQNATNNDATNKKFTALLKSLADESGYEELQFAPIIPIGHSAMASFPWNFAAWNPKRTLAVLSIHGDAPETDLVGDGRPNVDWGDRNINGIPGLMVMGEYEWWEDRLTPAFAFEAKYPKTPVAFFCDAGNGHFNSSKQLVDFLGMFIRKAVEWRLSNSGKRRGDESQIEKSETPYVVSYKLKPVNPRKGWLVDRWHRDQPPSAPAAPYDKYTGNRADAFWCFDKEMALATEKYYARNRGKLPQLVDFVQDGKTIPINPKAFEMVRLKFPLLDTTLTFHLQGTFLDTMPPGNPEKWTGLTNGTPIGHVTDGAPIKLSRVTGPVKQLGLDTFAIRFNRLSMPIDRRMGDIWLFAKQPGDAKYKSAVEQALMKIPFRLTEGAEQQITFPKILDQKVGTKMLALNATSSAGVPVYYYVREGPAKMDGNVLMFTKIPPRAKYPVKVTVVAWQYGRTVEPKLKSAEQVEQTFLITK